MRRIGIRELARFREAVAPQLMAHADVLASAMARGVPDNMIPKALNDRDGDNWRPLLGVAEAMGGDWPARARRAATALCSEGADDDRGPEHTLSHFMEAVDAARREAVEAWQAWVRAGRKAAAVSGLAAPPGSQRPFVCRFVSSNKVAAWLMDSDASGFADAHDLGTAKQRLARKLDGFQLKPTQRKVAGQRVRGYDVREARAVWRRYGPAAP